MKYRDLGDSAKECAYRSFQDQSCEFDADSIFDYWSVMLEEKGFYDLAFDYSGFGGQGDGACFTGGIHLREFLDAHPEVRNNHRELYIAVIPFDGKEPACSYFDIHITKIVGRSSYSHENTVHLGHWDYWKRSDEAEDEDARDASNQYYHKLMGDAEEDIQETCRDYMRQIFSELGEEYDYNTSLEAFLGIADFQDFNEQGGLT